MKYFSTRGGVSGITFEETVMMGLADDGGLLVPEKLPQVSDRLSRWKNFGFQQLSLEIMNLFVGEDISRNELKQLIDKSYQTFRHSKITPLHSLGSYNVIELFHGPTFAFKDVALQFLGNLFEWFLQKNGRSLNILGATSGDTGSAAIHGMRGKNMLKVFMLHPLGRVSPIQERQMTTVLDANVHNLAIEGSFDDAQLIVKTLFENVDFKRAWNLGSVNSINWARIMAQVVYYFHAWSQIARDESEKVSFVVPTGNFGNVLAGHYARKMGLPIKNLVVATNQNDILHRFFSNGRYEISGVQETWSPSMDIQISSNFERYLFELSDYSALQLKSWMQEFALNGTLRIAQDRLDLARSQFLSARVDNAETLEMIRKVYQDDGYMVDPHTAVGLCAAEKCGIGSPIVCLACAHPGKFGEAIFKAVGQPPELPTQLAELERKETRCTSIEASSDSVRNFIEATLAN